MIPSASPAFRWQRSFTKADVGQSRFRFTRTLVFAGCFAAVIVSITLSPHCRAQEGSGWNGAKVTQTDLLKDDKEHGLYQYSFAMVMTPKGCHVAKVEGQRGKVTVRRDGKRGKYYPEIGAPVFSPDGSRLAYVVREATDWFVVINDKEGPSFETVVPETFVFSNDGRRHVYVAKQHGRWVAVIDGVVQLPQGDLSFVPYRRERPVFSDDGSSLAYLEIDPERKQCRFVVNGAATEAYDKVGVRSFRFSPDGKRFSYGASNRGLTNGSFTVIDGKRCETSYEILGVSLAFSPDGKRFAYTGKRDGQWYLVEHGKPEVPIEGIVDHSLAFSPDSRRLVYAAAKPDTRAYLVLDGKAGPVHDGVGGSLPYGVAPNRASGYNSHPVEALGDSSAHAVLFSPDSQRVAYLARTGPTEKVSQRVYVDGEPDDVELEFLVSGMTFSSDSKRLAYGGRRGNRFFLVVDGIKGDEYDALGHFEFSADGKHVVFAALKGKKFVIVLDGKERAEYTSVGAGPVFRSDGVFEYLVAEKPSLYRVEVTGF